MQRNFVPVTHQDKEINLKVAGFIANRIAFHRAGHGQRKSFSRFIIRLSIVATVISVMVMIVTLSLANGFKQTVSEKVFSFIGHIRIKEKDADRAIISEETPIDANPKLVQIIRHYPSVETIHPYATKNAMVKNANGIEGVLVKGIDSTYDFSRIKGFIKEGRPIQFSDSGYSREIMLSTYTANQLDISLNDRVLIYFIRPPDASGEQKMGADKLTVVGIYKTGIEEYDKIFAIADIGLIRRLNYWKPNEIAGYEVFLKDYSQIPKVAKDIYDEDEFPATWNTVSAQSISPNIFDWLNLMDRNRNILIGLMLIIAVMNLITCLVILVLERIRMVGVLKSLGASNWTVQKIFLRHATIIATRGILIGLFVALALLYLQRATGFIRLKEEAYYVSTAAVKIVWWQVGLICVGTLAICFVVLMIPSLIIRKIQPVKAIQFR